MRISKDRFFSVGSELNLSKEQINAFWNGLEKQNETPSVAQYFYYLGALIVISSMTWFMTSGWDKFGGGGLFLIATTYAFLFTLIGWWLSKKKGLRIPSALFITIAVCMVPLAIYGLETYLNLWPRDVHEPYSEFYYQVNGRWISMELGTILAGIIALYFFPFPFLTAPIFFAAWFLTMDVPAFILGKELTWEQRGWLSMVLGFALMAISYWMDRNKMRDYAFWGYLFGTLAFWTGLNCVGWNRGELALFIFLIINVMMMFLAILLRRNVLMIFGAIGVFTYLSHLAYDIFRDSILFPFILTLLGVVLICLGIFYQKNHKCIEKRFLAKLPVSFKTLFDHTED